MQQLAILGLLLVSHQASGYVVLPGSAAMRSATKVSMASTMAPPPTRLSKIKSKQIGRYDLESMADEESEEITTYDSFAEADAEETNPPKAGETITGTVIEMDDNGALLSITGKMSAYIPLKEASLSPIKHVNELFQVGQEVTAECIGTLRGMPVMSLRPTQLDAAWEKILNLRAADTTFETTIIEVNRGGAVCEVEGLRGFIPGSHIRGSPDESYVGRTVSVSVHIFLVLFFSE
jgi:small subunit ribosomal protein S1